MPTVPHRPLRPSEWHVVADPYAELQHHRLLLLSCLRLRLLLQHSPPLLLRPLEVLAQEVGDGGGIHFVDASQRRHQQEEPRQPRNRPWLPLPAAQGPTGDRIPGEVPSVSVERLTSRAPLPRSALPPLLTSDVDRCGGGPSPAPWQPYGRDGAMLGAADPCDALPTSLHRVQPTWLATKVSRTRNTRVRLRLSETSVWWLLLWLWLWWWWWF